MYHNGEWGTVCDYGWNLNDAQVVCRELGFGGAINARSSAYYGEGSGTIWLDNVNCVGTELTIGDCSHNGWGIEDCYHDEDAGVKCSASNGNLALICVKPNVATIFYNVVVHQKEYRDRSLVGLFWLA